MSNRPIELIRIALVAALVVSLPLVVVGGAYSASATYVAEIAAKADGLPSPDGRSVLRAKASQTGDLSVWLTMKGHAYPLPFGNLVNAEVGWAPDSTKFFVTYSDGGNVGTYHVLVYQLRGVEIHSTEPIPNGRRLFRPTCFTQEIPNVGAIRWGEDSRTLLVAVEVPPHSSCASMGTFRAFEIGVPGGKVLKTYDQIEAKKLFGTSLGEELTNADDDCITHPEKCVPPGLGVASPSRRPQ